MATKPKTKAPANIEPSDTRFKPGQSGNLSGRPKIIKTLQELARAHTEEALQTLVDALKDPRTKVHAAIALLDRGYGKAVQTQNVRHIRSLSDLSREELEAIANSPLP
jgi:molybdate-binding protein